ncbi:MAG: HDIG domain-containing protein [Deltaproteobacteria bacterium]|nr:HDIG domain-containing protein [Deltaproteobacteria bacterium]MBW2226880.1 HDIG domain-containing protein [Deltaproteobacteria bacterium]
MSLIKTQFSFNKIFGNNDRVRWGILAGVTIIFTILLYPSLVVKKHSYKLGDVATKDTKAKKDFLIEDEDATENSRIQALENVQTVYDHDVVLSGKMNRETEAAFGDLQTILEASTSQDPLETSETSSFDSVGEKMSLHDLVWQKKPEFEEKLGISVSDDAYKILEKEAFSKDISNLISSIITEILENGVVTNKELLLKEADKGIILRDIKTKKEKVVFNLKHFYDLDQAKTMVKIIGQPLLKKRNYTLRNMIVDFSQRLIQPNITLNRSETEERKKEAYAGIKPIFHKIKAGEMLLREGERVTRIQLLKLNAYQEGVKKEQVLVSCVGSTLIILCILMTIYILCIHNQPHLDNTKNLLFLASILVTFLFISKISASLAESVAYLTPFPISTSSMSYGIPLAAATMTTCLFLGLEIAIPMAMLIAIGATIIFQNRFDIFIYFLLNSLMAAYWMQNCRERKVFIKAGLKLGFMNVILATIIDSYMGGTSVFKLLWDWAFAFSGGIAAGIVTAGIAPLLEIAFGYTTDIKLLELSNLDQPILRRLMIEAPGSYHHSVIVGTMVEAAASEIGANSLLAKVCGYYHDIGKIKKPLYFIENQASGVNKHDKLAPSMSSLILIAHVKDGVEIAKKNKLGQVIIDTIRQSHGTSLIRYFYEKAKLLKGGNSVNIDNYRYPGPKPQTREAGLVMLADTVEAASRTLANPTPSRIQGLVQNLINQIFSDGQLDNCELTLKDLHNIAKSFNKILNGIHHHRIEYPEQPVLTNGKGKNGSFDRQQAKEVQDIAETNSTKSQSHLKRLGLS